ESVWQVYHQYKGQLSCQNSQAFLFSSTQFPRSGCKVPCIKERKIWRASYCSRLICSISKVEGISWIFYPVRLQSPCKDLVRRRCFNLMVSWSRLPYKATWHLPGCFFTMPGNVRAREDLV